MSVDSKAASQDWCLTASFFEELDERSLDGSPLLDMPAPPTTDFGAQVCTKTAADTSVHVSMFRSHFGCALKCLVLTAFATSPTITDLCH